MDSSGSLASLFRPGMVVTLAERKRAMVPGALLDMLRLIRSLVSTRSSVFSFDLAEVGARFTGAPGLSLEGKAGLDILSLVWG